MNDREHASIALGEIDALERRVVVIPAEHWDAFEAWAHEPAKKIAALEYLARTFNVDHHRRRGELSRISETAVWWAMTDRRAS